MKRLTLNRVAKANLRLNRKAYFSLFLGILLAVYLATATCLCAWGAVRGHEEQMAEKVGWMDIFILGNSGASDEQLRNTGYFRKIGHVTVNAMVDGTQVCAGYYDETAETLMNRKLKEGRMPEKAGEIAAERSALTRSGFGKAAVGDTVTLRMLPVQGVTEEKTFRLVGVLNEQTDCLETCSEENYMRFPAILVSPEETYAVGSAVVHRVLTYAPLITYNQVMRHIPETVGQAYGVSREDGSVTFYDSGWDRAHRLIDRVIIWAVLGAALMLSACVGITSAMESLLVRKTQDIGMLRAIGATRRQIRRIYGAEAWLLTATALPSGLLLGIATAWIISCAAPSQIVFSLNAWLVIPILFLSALCVFAASRIPLYRASRQMPMGVLRDTAMLRKSGRMKSRVPFVPSRLIAGRRAGLHPLRHAGAAGMTALTLICALLLGELVLGLKPGQEDAVSFRVHGGYTISPDSFSVMIPEDAITRSEIRRIGETDGVSGVRSVTELSVNLLLDEVPEYFRSRHYDTRCKDGTVIVNTIDVLENRPGYSTDWLFYSQEDLADARARQDLDWNAAMNAECADQAEMLRAMLGFTGNPVSVNVYVADLDPDELKEYLVDGAIDTARLDSGEQVLLYAPTVCTRKLEGGGTEINKWLFPQETRDDEWDLVIRNDAFSAGMNLNLLELAGKETGYDPYSNVMDPESWKTYCRELEAVRADVSVGAVLTGPVRLNSLYLTGFSVILSEKGAQSLGLKLPSPEHIDVYTVDGLTAEQEERIEEEINQITMSAGMEVENQLEQAREYMNKKLRQMLLFAGLILLFFAVSVFMQVSGAARQIRSDTRTIGTLRAVGADLKTLVGCYRLPVWICAGLALVLPLLFYAVCGVSGLRLFTVQHPSVMIPILAVMAVCIALACIAGIRGRLALVSRQPIVDNIREL